MEHGGRSQGTEAKRKLRERREALAFIDSLSDIAGHDADLLSNLKRHVIFSESRSEKAEQIAGLCVVLGDQGSGRSRNERFFLLEILKSHLSPPPLEMEVTLRTVVPAATDAGPRLQDLCPQPSLPETRELRAALPCAPAAAKSLFFEQLRKLTACSCYRQRAD